jgi:hypothetical protein
MQDNQEKETSTDEIQSTSEYKKKKKIPVEGRTFLQIVNTCCGAQRVLLVTSLRIDLRVMGIRARGRQAMARDSREWRKTVLEAKVHNGLYCLRRSSVVTA